MSSQEDLYKMNNNNSLHLSDFSYWQGKKLYTQLMEEFYQICRLNRDKKYSREEILKIDNEKLIESKGFSAIMSRLFTDCNVFEPDPGLREDYEISEIELKNCVKKTLSEITYLYL